MTSEDLEYKSGVFEQAKLEYSPLGKFFNKGLKKTKERTFEKIKKILKTKIKSSWIWLKIKKSIKHKVST